MRRKPRKHSVEAEIRNIDLTKAGTSLSLEVFSAGEKVGRLEIGRGSITWWGRNKRLGKPLSWARFADWMERESA
jgi:hypothetical protein